MGCFILLLEVVQSKLCGEHHPLDVDVEDLQRWFLRLGVGVKGHEVGVDLSEDAGVGEDDVDTHGWGGGGGGFEESELIGPLKDVTVDELGG